MLQLGDGSWPSAQGAAQMKELEAGSLNLSDMFLFGIDFEGYKLGLSLNLKR